jgi:hypothetical protein
VHKISPFSTRPILGGTPRQVPAPYPTGAITGRIHGGDCTRKRSKQQMARLENWGLILAIRTGSADFSHHVLGKGWTETGYESKGGMLNKRGTEEQIVVPEEKDMFCLIQSRARTIACRSFARVDLQLRCAEERPQPSLSVGCTRGSAIHPLA